ncbi:hypothetical protein, partial [Pseudomonas helleri]|uniref:hypothetical protein n=1 Tax=Pseudomonas helleri TaxID=1608996 RepID=UPI001885D621
NFVYTLKGNRELLLSIMNASVLPLERFFVPAADPAQGFEHFARALNDTLTSNTIETSAPSC